MFLIVWLTESPNRFCQPRCPCEADNNKLIPKQTFFKLLELHDRKLQFTVFSYMTGACSNILDTLH